MDYKIWYGLGKHDVRKWSFSAFPILGHNSDKLHHAKQVGEGPLSTRQMSQWHPLRAYARLILENRGMMLSLTLVQQKNKYKTIWMHPGSKPWHLFDYMLVRRYDLQEVCKVWVLCHAECWTDHYLICARLNKVSWREGLDW